jgi:hypothetical protein
MFCPTKFYGFIDAGKLVFGFFYRFIGEKNFGQQNFTTS